VRTPLRTASYGNRWQGGRRRYVEQSIARRVSVRQDQAVELFEVLDAAPVWPSVAFDRHPVALADPRGHPASFQRHPWHT
jgi:hypothetical protein